jgi:hypothetical protein
VFVTLTDRARHLYEGEAGVTRGDVRGSTTRALLEARSLQLLGPGPWLRVNGGPDGAEVLVDDVRVGTLPYRGRIAHGAHHVKVQAEGYTAFEHTIDVPESSRRKLDVEVELRPAATVASQGDVAPGDGAEGDGAVAWQVFPLVLGGAGLVLATVTTVRLASGLDACVRADAAGRCTETRTVQVAPTVVYYSLSAALIGGAIAWLVIGSADEGELTAEVGVGALGLRGTF